MDYLQNHLDDEAVSSCHNASGWQPGDRAWPTIVQALEDAAVGAFHPKVFLTIWHLRRLCCSY